ncbi:hypothetical protein ELH96_19100 [Rhizobium leguminosarum]|nr:hypothetical protein ELH96_19100 [Rhizobium leguminosarum]
MCCSISDVQYADSDEVAPSFRDDCGPGFRDDLAPSRLGSCWLSSLSVHSYNESRFPGADFCASFRSFPRLVIRRWH